MESQANEKLDSVNCTNSIDLSFTLPEMSHIFYLNVNFFPFGASGNIYRNACFCHSGGHAYRILVGKPETTQNT
jgi:hypothetical protein